jgi:transcription antitermination factor NusA-like protein
VEQLRQVLDKHIPELVTGAVEIKGIAGKPGARSFVFVRAQDPALDAVGAVVGIRGARIQAVVAELNREMVDVVRWAESLDDLLASESSKRFSSWRPVRSHSPYMRS